ncbi:MAG TPA: DNA polymerase III subunit gamma/tau [Coxiellaceae bacterium]|nr:DNA polymerase III subunit gamma/tau [Coxiellaceae bacterium]
MTYCVLARKWRPRQFETVIGQALTTQALQNALISQQLHHAYLFTGTHGTGKTTLARILAKCLNCEMGITPTPCGQCSACIGIDEGRFVDLLEVDAASKTKVEDTRELLDNVPYAPAQGRFKIYLIDEVHMLSNHSFNALLKTLEEPPPHVKFLLATTDPERLPATILSRCLQFHLNLLTPTAIEMHLASILKEENKTTDAGSLSLIAEAANGSMRDALSLLDQAIALCPGGLEENTLTQMLGAVKWENVEPLLIALLQKNNETLMHLLQKVSTWGVHYDRLLQNVLMRLHDMALLQVAPTLALPYKNKLLTLTPLATPEQIHRCYEIGLKGQRYLSYAPSPQVGFEMILLKMLHALEPLSPEKLRENPLSSQNPLLSAQKTSWVHLLEELKLSGAAYLLASNCSMDTYKEDELQLILHPTKKPLIHENYVARIQAALSEYTGKPCRIKIELGISLEKTPEALREEAKHSHQKALTEALHQRKSVRQLKETFGASLMEETVVSNKNTNGENE